MNQKATYLGALIILLTITIFAPVIGAAAGLLPSADSLFGVTMPDMRFAIKRDQDEEENTERGQTFVFRSFTPADYQNLDHYLASDGMKLKAPTTENKTIHADLEKDDATIVFSYDFPERTASMFYPSSVPMENEAHKVTGTEGILPILERAVGTPIPNFRKILEDHAEPEISQLDEHKEIVYSGISEEDYSKINGYLSEYAFSLAEWHLEKGVFVATVKRNEEILSLQYTLTGQQFTWICPELYFEEDAFEMPKKPKQTALPELSAVYDTVMPRISSAILQYPDESETMEDGSFKEVYLNFGEKEYDAFSKYLSNTECVVGDYAIDETGALNISIRLKSNQFDFIYDRIGQKGVAVYPCGAVVEPQRTISSQVETETHAAETSGTEEAVDSQKFFGLKTGDTILMGYYEQDNDTDNFREPIEWDVIYVDKKKNQALLLSAYGLDGISYGETMNPDEYAREGISWENSHLRDWLNEDFYASAFSDGEKERILETELKTNDKAGKHKTIDKVFELSKAEANQYMKKANAMACTLTDYSKNTLRVEQGAETEDGYCLWWLRDMIKVAKTNKKGELVSGNEAGFVAGANGFKTLNQGSGCPVFCDYLCAVRPAIWIQLDKMPKETQKSFPLKEESDKTSTSSRYMSKSDLKDLARFYFGLYVGSTSSISMMDYSESKDKCVVLIVYGEGHTVGILMNRKDGSYLGLQRGF